MMEPMIKVSVGELLDKITILQLKSKKTNNPYVEKELLDLVMVAKELNVYDDDESFQTLYTINQKLWELEDTIRKFENICYFGQDFVETARSIYIMNDQRAAIKRKINEKHSSFYQEVKLLPQY